MTAWLVVGGGTAGCVVAARLSENAGDHVVLLEAGGPMAPLMASFLDELAAPGATWPGGYPIGRRLGGSSAVNGGVLSGDVHRLGTTLLAAEAAGVDELGPVDRALLAAAPDAEMALLARRDGRRVTTADCYLAPAVGRPNLEVRTGVEVDRVLLQGGRAAGVVAVNGERIGGDRVVLCGGAVQSPVVLLRSGVAVGEPGRGLTDHPGRVIELTLHPEAVVDTGALVTGAVLRRDATYLAEYVAMNHLGAGRPRTGALLVGLLSGGRHGSVGLDASGAAAVIFDPLPPAVEAALADAVDAGGALLTTPSFAAIVESYAVVDGLGGYAHAASTCASGRVVDEHGAVFGCDGLYVADASVLPTLPRCGTYLPVVLLAERLVRVWSRRYR